MVPLLAAGRPRRPSDAARRAASLGVRAVALGEAAYPRLLAEIADPPAVLLARGKELDERPAVAIVGSRRATRAGLAAARVLAEGLAAAGVLVVSGFARGVDAAAHRAALDAGGPTVGVFGCGVDVCYPAEHEALLAALLANGAVLSEFPLGTAPKPFFFPIRNRIIAGLVRVVVVVEAAERSGSLITARLASEYGRDVAAVPGPITSPQSAGSNALLKDGAIFVRSAEDVLAELPEAELLRLGRARRATDAAAAAAVTDPDAAAVHAALDETEPLDADALLSRTKLTPARLSAALVHLELEGLVDALPGGVFVRR